MCRVRLLAIPVIGVFASVAPAESNPSRARGDAARSAIDPTSPRLIVFRVANECEDAGRIRAVEQVDPRDLPAGAFNWRRRDRSCSDGAIAAAPKLGPRYSLVGTWSPRAGEPGVHYYFYDLDLRHPDVVRNYRALRKAQRREARNDYWFWKYEFDDRERREKLKSTNQRATSAGVRELQAGEYRQASLTLTLATELDHGDSASRIHLAQARMALGHDREAAKVLRRALQLQPKLASLQLDLERCYPEPDTFDEQIDALAKRVKRGRSPSAEEWFLLGYFEFQRNRIDAAYAAFKRAARGLGRDDLTRRYLKLTKPAAR
jgi:hypothetical protein